MPIEGFDYKEFATSMAQQAQGLVPQELSDEDKSYVVQTLGNFTLMAGQALAEDETLKLSAEQAIFITQIIAEWSFHKSIDLVHSGINRQYWDSIMQSIAYTIFEVSKQAITHNIPQQQLLMAVESQVVKVYKQKIEELQQKGIIDEKTMTAAQNQSNIDAMARQAQELQKQQEEMQAAAIESSKNDAQKKREEKRNQRKKEQLQQTNNSTQPGITRKQMKLITLAMFLKILSQDKAANILNKFDKADYEQINNYMQMVNLESQLDSDLIANCLNELRESLPAKYKLTKEHVMSDLLRIYKSVPRERIEKVIRNERPLVKRFISKAYDGEYSGLPLHVAGIVAQYVEDSI